MVKLKVKNFGPIKEGLLDNDGWFEIRKVTVFIGNNGSGKSTVAKLYSTLSWLEKSINRGDIKWDKVTFEIFTGYTKYQKIHNYFKEDTFIDYIGEKFRITYDKSKGTIGFEEVGINKYIVPKIMYVPSERNFLSTISDAYSVRGLSDNLFTFAEELKKAQKSLKGKKLNLQLGNYQYEYNEEDENSYIIGENHKINLLEASSGLQSYAPLYIVSNGLSNLISEKEEGRKRDLSVIHSIRMENELKKVFSDDTIPESSKKQKAGEIVDKYYNKCFINIVEEPEQNLYPTSQWEMLECLLKLNNKEKGNKLILTTHSPYIVNFMSIAIQGHNLFKKIDAHRGKRMLKSKLERVVALGSLLRSDEVITYQLDDNDGSVKILDTYEGIPSDNNFLNSVLKEGNSKFDELLEIEEEI